MADSKVPQGETANQIADMLIVEYEWANSIRDYATQLEAENRKLREELQLREKCSAFVMRDCPTHGETTKLKALEAELAALKRPIAEVLRSANVLLNSRLSDGSPVVAYEIIFAEALKALSAAMVAPLSPVDREKREE